MKKYIQSLLIVMALIAPASAQWSSAGVASGVKRLGTGFGSVSVVFASSASATVGGMYIDSDDNKLYISTTGATWSAVGNVVGSEVQAYDADLADLADGSLTGSKVGTGIAAGNVTSGTLPNAQLDADLQDLADGSLTGSKVGSGIAGDNITDDTIDGSEVDESSLVAGGDLSGSVASAVVGDDSHSHAIGSTITGDGTAATFAEGTFARLDQAETISNEWQLTAGINSGDDLVDKNYVDTEIAAGGGGPGNNWTYRACQSGAGTLVDLDSYDFNEGYLAMANTTTPGCTASNWNIVTIEGGTRPNAGWAYPVGNRCGSSSSADYADCQKLSGKESWTSANWDIMFFVHSYGTGYRVNHNASTNVLSVYGNCTVVFWTR